MHVRSTARTRAAALSAACLAALSLAAPASAQADGGTPIVKPSDKPLFAYLAWEKPVMSQPAGPITLRVPDSKGGYGYNYQPPIDLSADADDSLALRVDVGPGNQGKRLRLALLDADGTFAVYPFDLPTSPGGATLTPVDGLPLDEPDSFEKPGTVEGLDLSSITQVQVMGDWGATPLDVTVQGVSAVPATAAMTADRSARAEKDAAKRAEAERAAREARASITRGDGAPTVDAVGTLAPDLLQLTINAGHIPPVKIEPYAEQPGDEVRPGEYAALVWKSGVQGAGELGDEAEALAVYRKVDGQVRQVGFLSGDRKRMLPVETVVGDKLNETLADRPDSYEITSADDPAYASPVAPSEVHRKTKPTNMTHPDRASALVHRVILKLPTPLRPGATYTVALAGINTKSPTVEFKNDPRNARSDAVHASQIGYRPADPFKVAYLSTWLGTGGGMSYDGYDLTSFELIDDAGKTAYTGKVAVVKKDGEPEKLMESKDYSKTAVYALDFSDFDRPGTYRVFVPGVGTSGPVPIADDAWTGAFKVSEMGLMHHRSGIALGPPFTDYVRPRPFHPADGVKVFELPDMTRLDGDVAEVNAAQHRLFAGGKTPQTAATADAWGGYMDAGDWDRRSQHLDVSYLNMELLDLFPDFFEGVKLALPPDEAGNNIPDVLDEALFGLDVYKRLQAEDGSVRGGIESSAHPRDGEASWQESLVVATYAPESLSSYLYAANAARAARLLEPHDAKRAAEYRASAEKAWAWADGHEQDYLSGKPDQKAAFAEARELASVELLRLTRDAKYAEAFDKVTTLNTGGDLHEAALFAYARLPDGLGDDALKAKARAAVVKIADDSIAFAEGNAWGISNPYPAIPVIGFVSYFSAPGVVSRALPRAHALTGEEKYLAGTIRSCNFAAGANPDNLSYTIGVGYNYPKNPLHLDSRRTGQPAPKGITVYGPTDPGNGFGANEWMHNFFLNTAMTPNSRTWPAQEGYVDAYMWPSMNEYTVMQSIGPTAYTWGYLAARGR